MRLSVAVLPCVFAPALLFAHEPHDEGEQGFRSAWRDTFVDACSANAHREEALAWCGCVADQVLQRLAFDELLQGLGFDRALGPAMTVCDERDAARQVRL